MKKITLLLLCTFLTIISNAQLSWYAGSGTTTSVADINICDDTTYSIYCINPTASALTATLARYTTT